jgi:hypothetical protein
MPVINPWNEFPIHNCNREDFHWHCEFCDICVFTPRTIYQVIDLDGIEFKTCRKCANKKGINDWFLKVGQLTKLDIRL